MPSNPPYTWDTTVPVNTENITGLSEGTDERAMKVTLDAFFTQNFPAWKTDGLPGAGKWPIFYDLLVNIPAAGIAGRLFWASDTAQLFVDNGASWDEISLGMKLAQFILWVNATTCNSGAFADLPIGYAWKSGDGVPIDVSAFPTGARFRLTGIIRCADATTTATLQLYDATAAAAVSGSSVTGGTSSIIISLRSGQFDITPRSGVRYLRAQAKRASGSGAIYIQHVVLEVEL